MSVLVIAEHDNAALKGATLNTIAAAAKLGPITVLVAGDGCASVADQAAGIDGVAKVLLNRSFETDAKTMGELEAMAQGAAATTQEHRDAVAQFVAKKPLLYAGFRSSDWLQTGQGSGS